MPNCTVMNSNTIEGMAETATLEDVYFHLTERPATPAPDPA